MSECQSNNISYRINRTCRTASLFEMSDNGSEPVRSYSRTWSEIENMLADAEDRLAQWKNWYEQCRKKGDLDGMKESARNHKALQGVVKTLKWTLGEEGIGTPLE